MKRKVMSLLMALAMMLTLLPHGVVSAHAAADGTDAGASAVRTIELSITGQPRSVSASIGETAVFTVTAEGEELTYQWQFKKPDGEWSNSGQTGAKTNTLNIPVTAARNGYKYRCVVTDVNGSKKTSDYGVLRVKTVIGTHPQSVTLPIGETAVFTVEATGAGLAYQWQFMKPDGEWSNSGQTGAKTDTLSIPVTAARNRYKYRCVITDANGNTKTSGYAVLRVKTVIEAHPQSVTLPIGDTAVFTVEATGAKLTYQWQVMKPDGEWSNSGQTGAKTDSLSIPVTAARNRYKYRCVITDANGNTKTSGYAVLRVKTNITAQPQNVDAPLLQTAVFTVKAAGVGLTYRWQVKKPDGGWSNSGQYGSETNTLKVLVEASREGFMYRCVITDANGNKTISDAVTLTVKTCFIIQPKDVKAVPDGTAKFTVKASGIGLTYHWQTRAPGGSWMGTDFTGSDTATLSVPAKEWRSGYQYRCVITDSRGPKIISDAATLTVDPIVETGKCGDNLTWKQDYLGTLTITGTGPMWENASPGGNWKKDTKTVVIGPGVTTINPYAFFGRENLKTVTIGPDVTVIGDYAFGRCESLTGLVIPDSVTVIKEYAFTSCTKLGTVKLGNGLKTIERYAFWDTYITSLTFGTGLETIGDYAFFQSYGLKAVTLPNGLKTIGTWAFNKGGLTTVTVPDSVTDIGRGAFAGCENLTSVRLPSGLKRVESYLLQGCTGLKSLTIPESVESIGTAAFRGCTSLTTLTIPKNVKDIWSYAMVGCTKLSVVRFTGPAPEYMPTDVFYAAGTGDYHSMNVYYPGSYSSWNDVVTRNYGHTLIWVRY